ncbi:uncharacterized protein LOC114752499 isoform X2 [Neltuma alba]|uniref:uncharacterized protein LOC114733442 isoform X2 n=1 Tax=Neltuma alba TaxID=207710 RepID=UPI0010A4D577|nr:uncharacterized protein LOC114733442 isoform X2 [Prosopis alba]XP_028797064.1 uncharacterized protein LOC114752499 isoform X2 [Prosopis alba]
MVTLSSSVMNPQSQLFSGSALKPMDQCTLKSNCIKISPTFSSRGKAKMKTRYMPLIVRAGGDDGRSNNAGIFVGGFVLGGLIVGALGCVYAPQISKALAGSNKTDLMKKLPKFMYDEEKAMEKTRKVLTEKIAKLNLAIDEVSGKLKADEALNSEEVEASM